MRTFPANFRQLSGQISLGTFNPDQHRQSCAELVAAGFQEAYVGDAFLSIAPRDTAPDPQRLIFTDDDRPLLLRPDHELDTARAIIAAAGLTAAAAHFNQTLPPPGGSIEWVGDAHARIIESAARLGLKRVTTHPGWMFGLLNQAVLGAAAQAFRDGQIDSPTLKQRARARYGSPEKFYNDNVAVYRNLCALAAPHGITVTIEMCVDDWLELTSNPAATKAFITAVGAANLAVCIDSGHCHMHGLDPGQIIRACGSLIVETHFHDNYGVRDEHNPVGTGTVDWPGILSALRDIDYRGSITFEQRDHAANAANWQRLLAAG